MKNLFDKNLLEATVKKMPNGITNNFLIIKDINQHPYLMRINGRLWEPFTRADEAYNLYQLKKHYFLTSVIENNVREEFQISYFLNPEFRFKKNNLTMLKNIGKQMENIHRRCDFKNVFCIGETMARSFARLKQNFQEKYRFFYDISLRLLVTLNNDSDNQVSCHNDLLPSSVYCLGEKVLFVDWEYAGKNHRSYDVAFFSIKASLTLSEEAYFVDSYDSGGKYHLSHSIKYAKPVVHFLSLLWQLTARQVDVAAVKVVSEIWLQNLQTIWVTQSITQLSNKKNVSFFSTHRRPIHSVVRNDALTNRRV